MIRPSHQRRPVRLNPEKVAYWYFRLNGFLQVENFYVHPRNRGGARTDADLLAVRFPHRAERLYDDPGDIMEDDEQCLSLSRELVDVLIAEVKSGPCALNGPWTNPQLENVHRVLAAIGCLPRNLIQVAADAIYHRGWYEANAGLRVRLVSIGRRRSAEITRTYPQVTQVTWEEVLAFVHRRLRRYRNQKRQTENWDQTGTLLKDRAHAPSVTEEEFIAWAMEAMSVDREC